MNIFKNFFQAGVTVNNLESDSFEEIINQDNECIILDVRTSVENTSVRIPNSILIDIYKPDFHEKIDNLDRSKKYLVYCRSGNRSHTACSQMMRMGFENVFNLRTGITGWKGNIEKG